MNNEHFEINRNQRSQVRDALINYINNLSISDMDSLRTQAGMLSMLTSQTDEITRNSEVVNLVWLLLFLFKIFLCSTLNIGRCNESMHSFGELFDFLLGGEAYRRNRKSFSGNHLYFGQFEIGMRTILFISKNRLYLNLDWFSRKKGIK